VAYTLKKKELIMTKTSPIWEIGEAHSTEKASTLAMSSISKVETYLRILHMSKLKVVKVFFVADGLEESIALIGCFQEGYQIGNFI
jgi:hypothetical protein